MRRPMALEIDKSGNPFEFKGKPYVALAPVVRQMGGQVEWDNMAKTAFVTLDGRNVTVGMANEQVDVDGQSVALTAPPLVVDDTLIVPQSFFGDVLNRPL
jgi:hypothetical protein